MSPVHIKKGDTVKIITGKENGKTGKIIKIDKEKGIALVQGLNMVKRHTKPSQQTPEGGVVEKEAPVKLSNVMLVCNRCKKSTRYATKQVEGKKNLRVCRHCGEII